MDRGKKRIIFSGVAHWHTLNLIDDWDIKKETFVYKKFDKATNRLSQYEQLFNPNFKQSITIYAGITREVYLHEPEMDVIEKYFPVLLSLLENVRIEYSQILTPKTAVNS